MRAASNCARARPLLPEAAHRAAPAGIAPDPSLPHAPVHRLRIASQTQSAYSPLPRPTMIIQFCHRVPGSRVRKMRRWNFCSARIVRRTGKNAGMCYARRAVQS
jgi:hypothetical protein